MVCLAIYILVSWLDGVVVRLARCSCFDVLCTDKSLDDKGRGEVRGGVGCPGGRFGRFRVWSVFAFGVVFVFRVVSRFLASVHVCVRVCYFSPLSSHGVNIPPIPPTSPPHEQLLKELDVGGARFATLLSLATAHPPCKQMLAAVVVMLVAAIILLSIVHVVCRCC